MPKNLLIIRGHKDICGNETGLVETQCRFMNIDFRTEDLIDETTLSEIFERYSKLGITFDFIYLCTHGDCDGFDINMGSTEHKLTWADFGQIVCSSGILNDDTILLLACCRGGLFTVATDLMAVCNRINFVCGVKWTLRPLDITTGFIVLLYNLVFKKSELIYACQKASLATDYTFTCFDRSEIEYHPQYANRQANLYYELGWIDQQGNTLTDDKTIIDNTGIEPKN